MIEFCCRAMITTMKLGWNTMLNLIIIVKFVQHKIKWMWWWWRGMSTQFSIATSLFSDCSVFFLFSLLFISSCQSWHKQGTSFEYEFLTLNDEKMHEAIFMLFLIFNWVHFSFSHLRPSTISTINFKFAYALRENSQAVSAFSKVCYADTESRLWWEGNFFHSSKAFSRAKFFFRLPFIPHDNLMFFSPVYAESETE